KILAAILLK
ncbi:Serine transporter, partial [Haemophilus influenzae]